MTLTIVALLFLLLVGIYINARMRTARHLRCIAEEKGDIAQGLRHDGQHRRFLS